MMTACDSDDLGEVGAETAAAQWEIDYGVGVGVGEYTERVIDGG